MLYAILADIHGNLVALEAVLRDMEGLGKIDQVWYLGDIVGYGPAPHQCIERLRQLDHVAVIGNHEWAVLGKIDTFDFNPEAAEAVKWAANQLTQTDKDYLESLLSTKAKGDFTLAHGSPRSPIWEYLVDTGGAEENLDYLKTPHGLIGHSHIPLFFRCDERSGCEGSRWEPGTVLELRPHLRFIINPGSVGQPRDGDPRAAYALYDSDRQTVALRRIDYDIAATQREMERLGLAKRLIARLSRGV